MGMQGKRLIGRRSMSVVLSVALLGLAACSSDDDDGDGNGDGMGGGGGGTDALTEFTVELSPGQEVPPLMIDGATGMAMLSVDTMTGAISGTVTTEGLTGDPTMAHIHTGVAGTNGDVLIGFDMSEEGFSLPADAVLDANGLASLSAGELYVNVHTEANMSGEVRGQIIPETGVLFSQSELNGDNEVPPVVTEASATGVATVNTTTGTISAAIFTVGLEDADMAHIHTGVAGVNGEVLIGLTEDPEMPGVWRTGADAMLDAAGQAAFSAGGLYFNVHTPDNPTGEVRGQL